MSGKIEIERVERLAKRGRWLFPLALVGSLLIGSIIAGCATDFLASASLRSPADTTMKPT
jgi:hypothetical protein